MSRRPEGTDGSDHSYREKVEDLYKGLPVWRAAGWMLLHLTSIPTLIRLAWAFVPYYTISLYPEIFPITGTLLYFLALMCWSLASPASYKEKLGMMKATNMFMVLGTAQQVVMCYKYYMMNSPQQLYSRRIWKYMREEQGWTGGYWFTIFTTFESMLDMTVLLSWAGTALCMHKYITLKMMMDKKLGRDKKVEPKQEDEEPAKLKQLKAAAARKRPGRA